MGALQRDDVTDPYVCMKRRGQLEELARLIAPAAAQGFAMLALERRVLEAAAHDATTAPAPAWRRDWWVDPNEEPIQ